MKLKKCIEAPWLREDMTCYDMNHKIKGYFKNICWFQFYVDENLCENFCLDTLGKCASSGEELQIGTENTNFQWGKGRFA